MGPRMQRVQRRKAAAVSKSIYCTKRDAQAIVKRAIKTNAESKYTTTQSTETTVSTLTQGDFSNWYNLVAPTPAVGAGSRIGNEIRLQSVDIRGSMKNNAAFTNLVRVCVFYLEDTAAIGSTTDIFQTGNTGAQDFSAITGIDTMHFPLNKTKVKVLYDRVVKLGASASTDGSDVVMINKTINLKNRKVKFEGVSAGTDNQSPSLYLMVWAAEAPNDIATGTVVELSHYTRCWYTDM